MIAFICALVAALTLSVSAQERVLRWERVAPGVWRAQVGRRDG